MVVKEGDYVCQHRLLGDKVSLANAATYRVMEILDTPDLSSKHPLYVVNLKKPNGPWPILAKIGIHPETPWRFATPMEIVAYRLEAEC